MNPNSAWQLAVMAVVPVTALAAWLIAIYLAAGIAIFTYCGTVTFGITGDFAANPDLDVLAHGIESGLSELLAAAKRHHRGAATKGRPAMTHP